MSIFLPLQTFVQCSLFWCERRGSKRASLTLGSHHQSRDRIQSISIGGSLQHMYVQLDPLNSSRRFCDEITGMTN